MTKRCMDGGAALRSVQLAGLIMRSVLVWRRDCLDGAREISARAVWLQELAGRALKILGIEVRQSGPLRAPGIMVANHVGYLDVLVLAAVTPCVFVAKREVRRWPLIGRLARMAGTVFVDRQRRADVWRVAEAIRQLAAAGVTVVIFPEATSSPGFTVLPFHSALLAPLTDAKGCTVVHLSYQRPDGHPAEAAAWWGEMTLLPHLTRLVAVPALVARVRTRWVATEGRNRKELAPWLRDQVLQLATLPESPTATKTGTAP